MVSLFKKASEYSSECDADIDLVLRMKKSGKIFALAFASMVEIHGLDSGSPRDI
jgi:hypothetical protein